LAERGRFEEGFLIGCPLVTCKKETNEEERIYFSRSFTNYKAINYKSQHIVYDAMTT